MAVDISDLPAPAKQSVDISDLPAPARPNSSATKTQNIAATSGPNASVPTSTPTPEQSVQTGSKDKKGFLSQVSDVGKAGAFGGTVGAFTPEILTALGIGAGLFPPTAPAAPFLLAGGQLSRGARGAAAVTGALAGAGGSAAGKIVPQPEKVAVDIPGIQLTRKQLAETAGEFAGPGVLKAAEMLTRGTPILRSAIISLERFAGLGEAEFKKAAERQLATLRGKLPASSIESYRKVYDSIAAADERSKRAAIAEFDNAVARAKTTVDQFNMQANRVGKFNLAEAQRMQQKGLEDAQKIIDDAAAQVEKKYGIVRKAEAAGASAEKSGQQALSSIGNANRSRYDIGSSLQKKVQATDDAQVRAMQQQFNNDKTARDQIVSAQEAAGVFPENTNAFKSMMSFLNDKLVIGRQPPEKVKVDVTESSIRSAYERVRDAMVNKRVMIDGRPEELAPFIKKIQEAGGTVQMGTNPATGEPAAYRVYKTSFDALDQVRRKLGDAFGGKPPEGFDALTKEQAKDLYGRIRSIQVEYAGGPGGAQDNLLKNYSEGKELLDALRIPAGRKVIGTDRLNPEYLTQDPSDIPASFFKSKKSVQDLLQITKDPALVEQSAADYVARTLSGKKSADVQTFLKDNKEWIDLFPGLSSRITAASAALQRAESIVPKTTRLAEGLRTEIKSLPIAAQQKADVLRTKSGEEMSGRLTRSEAQQQQIRESGKKVAGEPKLELPDSLLSGKDPVKEIESLITGGETDKLKKLAAIIRSNSDARKAFDEALDITLSRMNPANISDDFERTIKPALLNTGLITPQKAAELATKIKTVQLTLEPSAAAQTARWIIKTGISGETALAFTD